MIKLKNIEKNNHIISCNILPEDSQQEGRLLVDLNSEKEYEYKLPEGYEWCKNHVAHAIKFLLSVSRDKEIPNEKLIMWN